MRESSCGWHAMISSGPRDRRSGLAALKSHLDLISLPGMCCIRWDQTSQAPLTGRTADFWQGVMRRVLNWLRSMTSSPLHSAAYLPAYFISRRKRRQRLQWKLYHGSWSMIPPSGRSYSMCLQIRTGSFTDGLCGMGIIPANDIMDRHPCTVQQQAWMPVFRCRAFGPGT